MKRILVLCLLLTACNTAPVVFASSQACPTDGGPCVGNPHTPVPPRKSKLQRFWDSEIREWMFYYYYRRR